MASKFGSSDRVLIVIQNYYFTIKLSITYLGNVIEDSQLLVPIIIKIQRLIYQ